MFEHGGGVQEQPEYGAAQQEDALRSADLQPPVQCTLLARPQLFAETNADVNPAKLNESFRTNSLVGPRGAYTLLHFTKQAIRIYSRTICILLDMAVQLYTSFKLLEYACLCMFPSTKGIWLTLCNGLGKPPSAKSDEFLHIV